MDTERKNILNLAINDSIDEKNDLHVNNNKTIYCFRKKNYIVYCETISNIGCENELKDCINDFVNNTFNTLINDTDLVVEDIDLNNNFLFIYSYEESLNESVGQTYNYYMNGVYDHAGSFQQYANRIYEEKRSPQKVSQKIKNYFDDNYLKKFTLKTDAGSWSSNKVNYNNNSLKIYWENDESKHVIITEIFPENSNKIRYQLKGHDDLKRQIHAFKIPIKSDDIKQFFSKIYLNHLRHFINKEVIKEEPFKNEFVFWEPHKLDYDYSFSAPNRNEIIHELLNFINIRDKPILDKFFEENELLHKQGYLQTLLNAANKAGIVDFEREGNNIIVKKGKNHREFLNGKIRRV